MASGRHSLWIYLWKYSMSHVFTEGPLCPWLKLHLKSILQTYLSPRAVVSILMKPAQLKKTLGPMCPSVTSWVLFSSRLLCCFRICEYTSRQCHRLGVTAPVSPPQCHRPSVTAPVSPSQCHHPSVTTPVSPPQCHRPSVTVLMSPPPCHRPSVSWATAPASSLHCQLHRWLVTRAIRKLA